MAVITITPQFVSAKSDGSDATLVQPSNWNATRRLIGGATGDLLYFDAAQTSKMSSLADVAVGAYLRSGGVAAAPVWSTMLLPNAATVGDLLQATATNSLAVLNAVATGNVLLSGGVATVSAWGKVGLTTHVSGILPTANGGTGIAFFTAAGPSTARIYTFPDAACTILTTNAAVSVVQGGTNIVLYAVGDLLYASGTTTLSKLADVAVGSVLISGGVGVAPSWSASPVVTAVLAGAGLVGAPSVSFSGDPDTGMYNISANRVGISLGGTLRQDFVGGVQQIYSNNDGAGNYDALYMGIEGGSRFFIGSVALGTGTLFPLVFGVGVDMIKIDTSGNLIAVNDNTYDIGASGATRFKAMYLSGGITHGAATLISTTTALTNGAGALTATLTNSPATGNPTKWLPIVDNGTTRYIPAW